MDEVRPAVVLTREVATTFLNGITVGPITTTVYGIATEVPVGRVNGLDRDGVISCDNITTVDAVDVLDQIGVRRDKDEAALVRAVHEAFASDPLAL